MTSQFADMTSSSNFFEFFLFLLSILVTGPSFMSMSSLVLELWQFSFIKDWPEIRKSEIPPSEFCLISGDWGKLGIPNLARRFLMKCYWILQNARVTAFTVSELFRENQHKSKIPPHAIQIRVKIIAQFLSLLLICDKIFERIIFNKMFRFFIYNNLIPPNQSSFKHGNSCIKQLLSITHEWRMTV